MVDTQGNNPAVEQKSDLEKLKQQNDDFEKELVRAREMRAEKQKLEAERMLASTAGNPIETLTPEKIAQANAQKLADEMTKAFSR